MCISSIYEQMQQLLTYYKQSIVQVMKQFSTYINNCSFFESCSGCSVKNIFNPSIWKEILQYAKKINFELEAKLIFNSFEESRYKSKLSVQKNNNEILIGLYKKGTHKVIDIPTCIVHHISINESILFLKEAIKKYKVSVYSEETQKGLLRYFQFFTQRKTGKVQLSIVLKYKNLFLK